MKYTIFISVWLLLFGGCQKCKKDPAPDPCLGVKKANFKIYEQVSDSLFETDKAMIANFIVFEADEVYDSYEWKVGNDARTWTTKKFSLRFTDITIPLEVRLIAKRKPRPDCIPNDDGVDTIVKPFQIVPFIESKLLGKFQGYIKEGISLVGNPLDTFTVDVYQNPNYPIIVFPAFVVDNFKRGNYPRISGSPDAFNNDGNIGYRAMKGNAREWYVINRNSDSITIKADKDYYAGQNQAEFKGKRLN